MKVCSVQLPSPRSRRTFLEPDADRSFSDRLCNTRNFLLAANWSDQLFRYQIIDIKQAGLNYLV